MGSKHRLGAAGASLLNLALPPWDCPLHQRITLHHCDLRAQHVLLRHLCCLGWRSLSLEVLGASYLSLSPVSPDTFCTGLGPAQAPDYPHTVTLQD